jgi:hypothetical protein
MIVHRPFPSVTSSIRSIPSGVLLKNIRNSEPIRDFAGNHLYVAVPIRDRL